MSTAAAVNGSSVKNLFGDQLVNPAGSRCALPDLPPNGVVGLLFTAQCFVDEFTPELSDFCRRHSASAADGAQRRPLEVVVVSLDDNKQEFDACRAATPWPALSTCDEQGLKLLQKLQRRYHYRQLPSLILVESDSGRVITDLGRQCVANDPEGLQFPWQLPSLNAVLSNGQLLNGLKDTVDSRQALEGKIKGLYFASTECAPCNEFTPALTYTYARLKSSGQPFEVVLVAADDIEDDFRSSYSSMPWLAVPFGDIRIQQLISLFQVYGYPQLIILNEENRIITTDGRNLIAGNIDGSNFPWPIQTVEELHDDNDIVLRIRPSLVLLTDGGREELVQHALHILNIATKEQIDHLPTALTKQLHFFYEGPQSSDVMDTVSGWLQLKSRQMPDGSVLQPRVIIVDLTEDRHFICWSDQNSAMDTVTEESIRHLVNGYYTGKVQLRPLPDP